MTMTDEPTKFRTMTTTEELVAAHAALVKVAQDLGLEVDDEASFEAVETGVKACERLLARIEEARAKKETTEAPPAEESSAETKYDQPSPATGEEGTVVSTTAKKSKSKSKSKKAGKVKAKKTVRAHGNGAGPKADSKTAGVGKLLKRASGCTSREVLDLTGWPAVSMPAVAKACGLKLRREKEKGKPTKYYGE